MNNLLTINYQNEYLKKGTSSTPYEKTMTEKEKNSIGVHIIHHTHTYKDGAMAPNTLQK